MARRANNSRAAEAKGTDPNAWMATFSDLLTLMLTFFVMLISMSSMDSRTLKQTFGFFDSAMGVLGKVASADVNASALVPINAVVSSEVFAALDGAHEKSQDHAERMALLVERIIDQNNLEELIEARPHPGGITITVSAKLLFAANGTSLLPAARPILESIGDLLKDPQLYLSVEGRQLRASGSIDPWQLASARALAVIEHLLLREKVSPGQLSVAAYGPGWAQEALPDVNEKLDLVLTWRRQGNGS